MTGATVSRKRGWVMALGLVLAAPLAGQTSVAEDLQLGIAAHDGRDPAVALRHFEAALAADSSSYEAAWRAGESLMDLGKQTPDSVKSAERDSLYARAERFGRLAVAINPEGPEGRYVLAAAIGRASLTKGKKERVRRAGEIREEALKAIELDPQNHKAYHVMGRWNAEIMRLSGLSRFFAKNFLGGKIFNAASWDSAIAYMQKAVETSPETIYHRLDLAEILVDRGRYAEARQQLAEVERLPIFDVMDPTYKEDGAALARRIAGKDDKDH